MNQNQPDGGNLTSWVRTRLSAGAALVLLLSACSFLSSCAVDAGAGYGAAPYRGAYYSSYGYAPSYYGGYGYSGGFYPGGFLISGRSYHHHYGGHHYYGHHFHGHHGFGHHHGH